MSTEDQNPIWDMKRHHKHKPGPLVDANGEHIHFAFWANLETGEVKKLIPKSLVLYEDGTANTALSTLKLDKNGNAVEETKIYPAPLGFLRKEQEDEP